MEQKVSRLPPRERLEDQYKKVALPALAAALDTRRILETRPKQMNAETLPLLQQMSQS